MTFFVITRSQTVNGDHMEIIIFMPLLVMSKLHDQRVDHSGV